MKYRVEAHELVVKIIEADSEEEACEKMDEWIQGADYRDLDWSIGAYLVPDKIIK